MEYLQVVLIIVVLMILHETGHILAAKILGLKVYQVGFQWHPYPHLFVAAAWPRTETEKLIYLFSGPFVTANLFFIAFFFDFFGFKHIYYAFAIQLIVEANPFYSDFTIAAITKSKPKDTNATSIHLSQMPLSDYLFSFKWYVHFSIWTFFIIVLLKSYH